MIHIRPYQILRLADGFGEEIRFFMPQPEAKGSLTTIESLMLLKLMRLANPDYLFEFGTYKGLTTRLLLENLPESHVESERLFTLDLSDLEDVRFQGSDGDFAGEAINLRRKYEDSPRRHLVKQLLQDSMTLDPGLYREKFAFIFIDANHALDYVTRDTENAFKMLAQPPSCIVWHDYRNPEFPELTAFLDQMSRDLEIHHIEDTMLAFHFPGRSVAPRETSR